MQRQSERPSGSHVASSEVRRAAGGYITQMLESDIKYGRQLPPKQEVRVFDAEDRSAYSGGQAVAAVVANKLQL